MRTSFRLGRLSLHTTRLLAMPQHKQIYLMRLGRGFSIVYSVVTTVPYSLMDKRAQENTHYVGKG